MLNLTAHGDEAMGIQPSEVATSFDTLGLWTSTSVIASHPGGVDAPSQEIINAEELFTSKSVVISDSNSTSVYISSFLENVFSSSAQKVYVDPKPSSHVAQDYTSSSDTVTFSSFFTPKNIFMGTLAEDKPQTTLAGDNPVTGHTVSEPTPMTTPFLRVNAEYSRQLEDLKNQLTDLQSSYDSLKIATIVLALLLTVVAVSAVLFWVYKRRKNSRKSGRFSGIDSDLREPVFIRPTNMFETDDDADVNMKLAGRISTATLGEEHEKTPLETFTNSLDRPAKNNFLNT